jgi:pimeloyl-ACP methyl ester carboxylesterase
MMTRSREDEQRRKRRKRLLQGILVGGAAIGIPALANLLIERRAGRLEAPSWGRTRRYAWRYGEVLFQRLGNGPAILLLHSLGPGHDSHEWRRVAEILAERYTVLAPDLLGWGRSEKPAIAYDGELYIQFVSDFLHDVVRERAAVVAAGLPAAYAAQVAVDEPEALSALALVSPLGIEIHGDEPDLKDAVIHRLLRLPVLGTTTLNLYTTRSGIANHLRREVFAEPERADAAEVEHHYRASHQRGAQAALAAYLAGYLNHSVEETLGRVTQPVWLAWGRLAANPPVEAADLWVHALPEPELEVFETAGSLPHAEAPTAFCQRLEGFLTRHA